ncbi:MAG: DUF6106 family protein [Lachnospiraceae bacterium]
MGDYYTEQLVKRKATIGSLAIKAGMIVVTGLSFLTILLFQFAIMIPVLLIVADVFLFKRLNVEYEYLYVNGDLDIDKIMSKEKRKRVFATTVNDMDIIAPSNASELKGYPCTKVLNFSSGETDHKTYEMIVTQNGQKTKVIFEPNGDILEGIRLVAPRKVII